MTNTKAIRDRAWHYLTPDVAACAGLRLDQLQQFVAGRLTLSEDQLTALAKRMRMTVPELPGS